MKAKFLSILAILICFTVSPALAASYYTDEDIEYQASDDGDYVHPTSVDPILLKGTLSLNNKCIVNTFFYNFGKVTFRILDENGQVVLSKSTTTVAGGNYTVSIEGLAAGNYKIYCLIPNEKTQVASFRIPD